MQSEVVHLSAGSPVDGSAPNGNAAAAGSAGGATPDAGRGTSGSRAGAPSSPRAVRPVAPQQVAQTRAVQNIVGGKAVSLQALVLPSVEGVPPYKAWSWAEQNMLCLETGQRMFYTDPENNETVPASEDEDDADAKNQERRDLRELHGSHRQRTDHLIREIVAQFGTWPAVFEALHQRTKISAAALEERAAALAAEAAQGRQPRESAWGADKQQLATLDEDFHAAWCRMCRTYACRIHRGVHARPVLGPLTETEQRGARGGGGEEQAQQAQQACGRTCYLRPAGAGEVEEQQQQPQPSPQQQPVPPAQQPPQDEGGISFASSPVPVAGSQHQTPQQPEVTSPPSKQRRLGSEQEEQQPTPAATGAAAAAAAAAAAHVPARRRRSSGSGDLSGSGGSDDEGGARSPRPWSEWEDSLLQQGIEVWGRQPCKVASLVGSRTCSQVHARMLELQGGGAGGQAGEEEAQRQRRGKGRKQAKAQVKPRKPAAVYERAKRPTNQMWPQFVPCSCIGPCKANCPCAGDANFCEKFCACDPAKCANRFPGCTCKCGTMPGRRCSSKQCPCLAAGRECDPDLCKTCKPTLTGDHRDGWQCNNFRIRLGQRKRVIMGLSEVQGWGAFLQQAAAKDEFLGEYCGELVTHEEADRRGTAYDRDDNSYLFNLNLSWVIDARQKGNTLRFANHSTSANCRAEILMVDGDHRVAVVANRDCAPGDELFYNYHYDRRVAPDWAAGQREGGEPPAVAKKNALKRQGSRGALERAGSRGGGGGSDAAP